MCCVPQTIVPILDEKKGGSYERADALRKEPRAEPSALYPVLSEIAVYHLDGYCQLVLIKAAQATAIMLGYNRQNRARERRGVAGRANLEMEIKINIR
jgi:hypothetical protein